jgi:hypothetical protein
MSPPGQEPKSIGAAVDGRTAVQTFIFDRELTMPASSSSISSQSSTEDQESVTEEYSTESRGEFLHIYPETEVPQLLLTEGSGQCVPVWMKNYVK